MKIALSIGLVVVLILGGLFAIGHKSVHAEMFVDASPEDIWAVLVDTEAYSEWNPIFVSMDGELAAGKQITVGMKLPDGKVTPVQVEVRAFVENSEINQFGGYRGILTYDHRWLLTRNGTGTSVVQHEEYRGIAVPFWDPGWVEDAYEASIKALAARVVRPES